MKQKSGIFMREQLKNYFRIRLGLNNVPLWFNVKDFQFINAQVSLFFYFCDPIEFVNNNPPYRSFLTIRLFDKP